MNTPERASLDLTAARGALTVLLIDDESHVRTFLRTALGTLGVCNVVEAENGCEGVEAFDRLRPDLVLLDVNLPDRDGGQVIREILARDPEAAVVMVTSESRHEQVKAFCNAGALAYILKYLPAQEVCAQLDAVLASFAGTEDEGDRKAS